MLFFKQYPLIFDRWGEYNKVKFYFVIGDFMSNENFVPQWILDSKTAPDEVNKDVDKIVGGYVAAFMKRGFSQSEIGELLVPAFALPLEEVEKRVDAVLSCGINEQMRILCARMASRGFLFSNDNNDPREIIELIKEKYGEGVAQETLLVFPEILSLWKKADVRDNEEYKEEKKKAEFILREIDNIFPEI